MEKNKKRLIFFMPSMEGGGVEKNLILIANYISKYISNVSLITFDNKFNKFFYKKIKVINYKRIKNKRYSKYSKYFYCLKILINEHCKNKNFLVFSFQANIYTIILSFFLNFKIISRSNSSPTGWNKSYIKNSIFKFFLKRADSVVVNSSAFKKEIKKKFNINSVLIYNPLNKHEILEKSKNKINKKFFSNKKNNLKIINIARLTNQKDQITILKAIKIATKNINCELLIIGYGVNRKLIKNKINEFKLNKVVKLVNYKSNPYPYLKYSDLFVLSSKYEGLPNVLLEAQTLKKYVISSDCPTGPKEILINGKIGSLFKIGDYKKLASEIIKYDNNKKIYKKKIIKAYNMLHRFDFEKNCKKYLSLIQKYL